MRENIVPLIAVEEEDDGYHTPSDGIWNIADPWCFPSISFSPLQDKVVFSNRRSLPPLESLARSKINLADILTDAKSNTEIQTFYASMSIFSVMKDCTLGPAKEVYGYPNEAKINFPKWSPDGNYLAFTVRSSKDDDSAHLQKLWLADTNSGEARQICEMYLNTLFWSYEWINNSTLVICTIPSRGQVPKEPTVFVGPKVMPTEKKNIESDAHDNLMDCGYREDVFHYHATSQLVLLSLDGSTHLVDTPKVYTTLEQSPDGNYMIIRSLNKPYSVSHACDELWTTEGKFLRQLCVEGTSVFKRSIHWRSDKPSTLVWVEAQDGGDSELNVSPRDIIYSEPAEPLPRDVPLILYQLDHRFDKILWCDDSLALVYESWSEHDTKKTQILRIWPGGKGASKLLNRQFDSPMMREMNMRSRVIAKFKKNEDDGSCILLYEKKGNIPFLILYNLDSGREDKIWQSSEGYCETLIALICGQGELELNRLKILASKESRAFNPQYCILTWPEKKMHQITCFPHPYAQISSGDRRRMEYQRSDGVSITATLYLPPAYDPVRDGPLPCLLCPFPEAQRTKAKLSPYKFNHFRPTSPLIWLAKRFVIMTGHIAPIVGKGNEAGNNRYVEQLVASAEAAVKELIRLKVAQRNKIAVYGHSFGAFTTANFIAHAPHLFCCGIARSGVYNRTLTPLGFQTEKRTLWEAFSTYAAMSPFLKADRFQKPILVIHGENDENPQTVPMQCSHSVFMMP